ncbi:hypothetical protein V5O48_011260 [Marasmius crinis-equi]|uniref:DUF6533 domain-containing protein n=1 Tax=Marasmius crinis-equi TaxID=585013 RepID=A0ABR3F6F4_9AGAR
MSSKSQQIATHYLQFDIQWASLALLYYDYALTFTWEVKYIWSSKFRLSTVLYVFCRYALVANVLYLLAISKHLGDKSVGLLYRCSSMSYWALGESCDAWFKVIGVLSVLGRLAIIG